MLLSTSLLSKETRAELQHQALVCNMEKKKAPYKQKSHVWEWYELAGVVSFICIATAALGTVLNLAASRQFKKEGRAPTQLIAPCSHRCPVSPLHTSEEGAIHKYMQHDWARSHANARNTNETLVLTLRLRGSSLLLWCLWAEFTISHPLSVAVRWKLQITVSSDGLANSP